MTEATEPTATPWRGVLLHTGDRLIVADSGHPAEIHDIASIDFLDELTADANLSFICRAVNAWDDPLALEARIGELTRLQRKENDHAE